MKYRRNNTCNLNVLKRPSLLKFCLVSQTLYKLCLLVLLILFIDLCLLIIKMQLLNLVILVIGHYTIKHEKEPLRVL